MTTYCKRLIEVDLPIKRISAHARREKSIRHGHISTLHIWWARRPLAACRAVLCASLWPDPADDLCPELFCEKARELMQQWADEHLKLLSAESYTRFIGYQKEPAKLKNNTELRKALLDFIADFADWKNSGNKDFLLTSNNLTNVANKTLHNTINEKPLILDPFAGGGAIPIEALRVGGNVFASDLNPIAVLLNKIILEYIPRYGLRLAEEVEKCGKMIREQLYQELKECFPVDSDGAIPIAYLWARTIQCEGPKCGASIPLIRSPWLARKHNRSISLKLKPNEKDKHIDIDIVDTLTNSEESNITIKRGTATCPCCGFTTPIKSVRKQLKSRNGGSCDSRLFCVVTVKRGEKGRFYRVSNDNDINAFEIAIKRLSDVEQNPDVFPFEETPRGGGRGAGRAFSQRNYGMDKFSNLFNQRQLLVLATLVRLINKAMEQLDISDKDFVKAIHSCVALVIDRMADSNSSLSMWQNTGEKIGHTFGRQALSMAWDYCENNPFCTATRSLNSMFGWIIKVCKHGEILPTTGTAQCASAASHPLPNDTVQCLFTDPPYYDAVPYADLSDFFYVWLKRILGNVHADLFSDELSPKDDECVVDETKGHDKLFFENLMERSLSEARRIISPDGIGNVVFAHKTTGGWESQLQAMVKAGWIITGSWPIDTEMGSRLRAMNSAALASSIHLVCRPRENPDGSLREEVGDWRDVLQELPQRIHKWMPRLAEEGVVGADAIFACLGPALEIFSRYSKVEKASGEVVTLQEYLEHVWAAVEKEALNMIFEGADAAGFEEDSRLTAMWLWTLSTGNNGNGQKETADEKSKKTISYSLEYDAARKIAQGLVAHLENLHRVIEIKSNKARLLSVAERTKYLFGKDESQTPAGRRKKKDSQMQLDFMKDLQKAEREEGGWGEKNVPRSGETVLDQLHQAMILFAAGRGEAMKRFLVEEGIGRDGRFWRLAQALSALYPSGTDEKRWVDGVLARKKGLGF
jgi:adenine-specific DNA methylase